MSRVMTLVVLLLAVSIAHAQTPAPKTPPAPAKPAAPKTPSTAAKPPAPRAPAPAPTAKPAAPAPAAPAPAAAMTDEQKTIYALGLVLQRSLQPLDLSASEVAIVARAIADASAGKPAINLDEWGPKIEPFAGGRAERAVLREKAASTAYLDKAATAAGAVRTSSGMVYRELRPGIGPMPKAADSVKVHYRGTLRNGTVFDNSYDRNEPVTFALTGVIACWTEGLQLMRVGGKAQFTCPSFLAYGDDGNQDIPGGAALTFEVDLLEIVR